MQRSVLHVHRDDTHAFAILHHQVEGEVLDEKVGVVAEGLTVKSVKDGVAGSIGGSCASICLTALSVFQRLSTERSLIDFTFFRPREGDTEVFELAK